MISPLLALAVGFLAELPHHPSFGIYSFKGGQLGPPFLLPNGMPQHIITLSVSEVEAIG